MKNLNKLIRILQSYYWLGFCFCILQAQVVITEFFINSAEGTQIPQYIELYNTDSLRTIDLEGWSIITKDESDGVSSYFTEFSYDNDDWVTIHNSDLKIEPNGYFLISSNFIGGDIFSNNHNSDIEVLFILSEGGSIYLYEPGNSVHKDSVAYNIPDSDGPIDIQFPIKTGHSTILQLSDDTWSLSPETENSEWLYEGSDRINFGSPRKENAFRLFDIQYLDDRFPSTYVNGDTLTVYGDYNNYYRAEPFIDCGVDNEGETICETDIDNWQDSFGNGEWDNGEDWADIYNNGLWDSDSVYNNYSHSLEFSWVGTFDIIDDQSYELIIIKNHLDTFKVSTNSLNKFIYPEDIFIDSLGEGREIADYTWMVELTKTFSNDSTDTIYSDKYTFTIDASDYGRYGCVDNGCCTNDPNEVDENDGCPRLCPTNAFYEESYLSNHPFGCVPGYAGPDSCYSALNYYKDANINSNTCHYVSLSIPAFVVGDPNETVRVPVYFKNDSLAEINEIEFTLNYADSSIVEYEGGTILGTVLFGLNDATINAEPESDSVIISLSSAQDSIAGIITYLYFKLEDLPGEYTALTISAVSVNGGNPINGIPVPVSGEGELVILQPNYEIWGNVVYYSGDDPYEVPKVKLSLSQKYNGDILPDTLIEFTNQFGYYKFELLTEGNYNLSFSKESGNDSLYGCNGDYISGTDISRIARHVTGSEPFNAGQEIAGDVSLDGTVSGQDASLVAQYIVGPDSNFNDFNTHWIFIPADTTTLAEIYADLIKDNGEYMIEYSPLVFDDENRDIYAYRLGDVNGNYCHDQLSRFNSGQVQFTNIAIDYMPVITLPLIISEAIFLEGMDIEIGYDKDIFEPLSITFNSLNQQSENYESLSNLFSHEGTIKTVTWAADDPQLINGIIGEVSFNWNNKNKSGKIWLKDFQVNDEPVVGGISIIGLNDNDIADGVNIINSLVPVQLSLHQNYPNPFNPQTTIKWSMPLSGIASLEVYNLQGQLLELLFNGQLEAGIHEQIWDATAYSSGIYFYRMTTNKKTLQKVMLLLK